MPKFNSKPSLQKLLSLSVLIALSACARGGSGPEVGRFAKPGETAQKLRTCATTKVATSQPYRGNQILVCRRGEDGKIAQEKIYPAFYVSGKKGRMRIAQVIGVKLIYPGTPPKADFQALYEEETHDFLRNVCAPKFQKIFKQSGVIGRFIFQTRLDTDRLASQSSNLGTTVGIRDDFFDDAAAQPNVTDDQKKRFGQDLGRPTPNVWLNLAVGSDDSVSLSDHVMPVSSGPLKKEGNDDQKTVFCAQLLERVGENLGLGGLAADDKTCSEEAVASKAAAKTAAQNAALSKPKTTQPETAKPEATKQQEPAKPQVVGIMKASETLPADFNNLKLGAGDIDGILSPICGSLLPLPKTEKPVQK